MIPVLLAIVQISAASISADQAPSPSASVEYDGSVGQTQIVTPRFLYPDVSVDGMIDV